MQILSLLTLLERKQFQQFRLFVLDRGPNSPHLRGWVVHLGPATSLHIHLDTVYLNIYLGNPPPPPRPCTLLHTYSLCILFCALTSSSKRFIFPLVLYVCLWILNFLVMCLFWFCFLLVLIYGVLSQSIKALNKALTHWPSVKGFFLCPSFLWIVWEWTEGVCPIT